MHSGYRTSAGTPAQLMPQQYRSTAQTPGSMPPPSTGSKRPSTIAPIAEGGGYGKLMKKKKPTDKNLPPKIDLIIPESKLYTRLHDIEKKIDATILRKKLDLQETLSKPVKARRTLRIFISNTADDQPDFDDRMDESGHADTSGVPNWTLRVEGKLIEPSNLPRSQRNQINRKFSHFVKSLTVELDRDCPMYENNLIEWNKSSISAEVDGFEIKRRGDTEVKCRIIISLCYGPDRFKIADELADILALDVSGVTKVGLDETFTKRDVVLGLWSYIKHYNLQDQDDKRTVNCDERLRKIFNCDKFTFPHAPDMITPFLAPPDPVVIGYTIRVDKPFNISKTAYDVEVEVDDVAQRQKVHNFVSGVQYSKDIADLDDQIASYIHNLSNLRLKHSFMLAFATQPVEFINTYVASQSRDLEVILGEKRTNKEEVRKSEFWVKAEAEGWLKNGVGMWVASRLK